MRGMRPFYCGLPKLSVPDKSAKRKSVWRIFRSEELRTCWTIVFCQVAEES